MKSAAVPRFGDTPPNGFGKTVAGSGTSAVASEKSIRSPSCAPLSCFCGEARLGDFRGEADPFRAPEWGGICFGGDKGIVGFRMDLTEVAVVAYECVRSDSTSAWY